VPHRAPASKSFAHQRAEDLRRAERSAVHEEARVQEHLGAYRCLSDEYPQQIVPWCPSSRSDAHVRRRPPRGRPRGTAWRTATRQQVVLVVGPQRHPSAHTRVDPGARRRPWRLHGFPAYNGPRRNPSKAVGRRGRTSGRPDSMVSLARCAPSIHTPWAWRMTSAQAPQHGWASRSRATHLRCLEVWRPVAAGRNARRQ
jgi:hypothetical protein